MPYPWPVQPPIRVAVAGFWHVHAGDYARTPGAHPDTELVAVWDDDPSAADRRCRAVRGRVRRRPRRAAGPRDLDGVRHRRRPAPPEVMTRPRPPASTSSPRRCSRRPSPRPRRSSGPDRSGVKPGRLAAAALPRLHPGDRRGRRPAGGWAADLRPGAALATTARPPTGRLVAGAILRSGAGDRRRADRPRLSPGVPDPAVPRHTAGHGESATYGSVAGAAVEDNARGHHRLRRRSDRGDRGRVRRRNPFTIELFGTDGRSPTPRRPAIVTVRAARREALPVPAGRPGRVRAVGRPHPRRHPRRRKPRPRRSS